MFQIANREGWNFLEQLRCEIGVKDAPYTASDMPDKRKNLEKDPNQTNKESLLQRAGGCILLFFVRRGGRYQLFEFGISGQNNFNCPIWFWFREWRNQRITQTLVLEN